MRRSRPMTAPASRFKKKRFPPEITGIPSSTVSPRVLSTRPLSSIQRPVSAPITPARSQFDELSSSFDNFAEQTSVNITSPFLVAQFLRFSSSFNHFCDTSSTIKNSFFGNYAQRMKINNSSIIVQARAMMSEWNDFQNFFLKVKSINIIPIYKLISNTFISLSSAISDCYDLCGVGSRFETIPKPFQKYIDEEIKSLNNDALCICNDRVKSFDPIDFSNRTSLFIQKTHARLLNSFFKNRMTTADVMRRKMALNIAYENLIKYLNGTQNFDLLAKEVEDQIILMNQSIGELYSSLHLPISLRKVKPILDDEGRSLNLSILRPAAAMIIDRTEAVKESARRADSIKSQIEKVESKIQKRKKKLNKKEPGNDVRDDKSNENNNNNGYQKDKTDQNINNEKDKVEKSDKNSNNDNNNDNNENANSNGVNADQNNSNNNNIIVNAKDEVDKNNKNSNNDSNGNINNNSDNTDQNNNIIINAKAEIDKSDKNGNDNDNENKNENSNSSNDIAKNTENISDNAEISANNEKTDDTEINTNNEKNGAGNNDNIDDKNKNKLNDITNKNSNNSTSNYNNDSSPNNTKNIEKDNQSNENQTRSDSPEPKGEN